MKGLSRGALALLDSARRADSAPPAMRERARRNFVSAVAAGTVSVSAAVAKAASMGAIGSAAPAGLAVSGSFTATWVSAVFAGTTLGIVALAPASRTPDAATPVAAVHPVAAASTKAVNATQQRQEPVIEDNPADSNAPAASTHAPSSTAHFQGLTDATTPRQSASDAPGGTPESELPAAPPSSTAAFDAVGSSSKASIARETELLAQVQRALQQGRPASALALLNRYTKDFPRGMLEEEAIASRIVALCQFGRNGDAERWRSEFFRRYPNSPLSGRVRNACAAGASAP
jgi:hypothetical protein